METPYLKLKTAATKDPVTLDEVKQIIGLNDDQTQFDGLLMRLIKAAVIKFEVETNMVVMEQTWYQYMHDWPVAKEYIEIRKPPLSSVTAIKYTDSDGGENTWSSSNYTVEANVEPGRVRLGYLKNYPTATLLPSDEAIEIEFVAGVEDAGAVDEDIKLAIELIVAFWYANREKTGRLPASVESIINNRRVYYL